MEKNFVKISLQILSSPETDFVENLVIAMSLVSYFSGTQRRDCKPSDGL